jgi:hypothetical protein
VGEDGGMLDPSMSVVRMFGSPARRRFLSISLRAMIVSQFKNLPRVPRLARHSGPARGARRGGPWSNWFVFSALACHMLAKLSICSLVSGLSCMNCPRDVMSIKPLNRFWGPLCVLHLRRVAKLRFLNAINCRFNRANQQLECRIQEIQPCECSSD